jgi:peptidyl-prolyl cis-trans isomerase A (cyclophilin A)
MMKRRVSTLLAVCGLVYSATVPAKKSPPKPPVPAEYKVKLETTKGDVVIQVHRDWAPLGADHFYELVTKHYYDNEAFFRAIKGFVVQFGVNGDPKVTARWTTAVKDDPRKMPNKAGTVTFAQTSAPNSRSTHIFINLADNADQLDSLNFTPFGEVISGMENVNNLYMGYGDGPPDGAGPDQQALAHGGNAYLKKGFPLLDYIKTATVIDPPPPVPAKPAARKSTATKR